MAVMNTKCLPHDSALAHLFAKHDDKLRSGFITRLDRTSLSRKKLVFVRSLAYNLAILVVVAALSTVMISRSLLSSVPESLRLTMSITQNFLLSWAIYILLRTTCLPFFLGECRLRWKYGFRPAEVVIRRSPLEPLSSDRSSEQCWRSSLRAINPALLYSNPASILAHDFWVMEHAIIFDVYAKMETNEINEEDLEFTVWKEQCGAWVGLELWRMHNIASNQQEVSLFKAFLTRNGKHELLSTWERMFDTTTKSPAIQTSANYRSMVKRFSREGIDYETVWSQMSGNYQRPVYL